MKPQGVFLLFLGRMLTPRIIFTHLYMWCGGPVLGFNVLPKRRKQCPWLGLEPRLLDPESSALTMHEAIYTVQKSFLVIPLMIPFGAVL